MSTSHSYGDIQISGCHSSQTPEPIDIKFDVDDYVSDLTPHAKIQNSRPIWGVWAYGRNITLTWFVLFLTQNSGRSLRYTIALSLLSDLNQSIIGFITETHFL